MSQTQTVTINGRKYDVRTGLPVTNGTPTPHTTRKQLRRSAQAISVPVTQKKVAKSIAKPAHKIHTKTQRSKTLNRKFIQKPAAATSQPAISKPTTQRIDGITVHTRPHVSSRSALLASQSAKHSQRVVTPVVAPEPIAQRQVSAPKNDDLPAMPHPTVTRAHEAQAAKKAAPEKQLPSASAIKQSAIQAALDAAPAQNNKQHKHGTTHRQRLAGVFAGCAALVLFAGYLTYLNVPNISVRVAAAQAGINASYPGYHPDGYKLNGPVAYSDGQVQIKFAANTGDNSFTLKQSRSTWDSSALLENYVKQKAGDEYSISQEKGITIYNYDNSAAWVSGGILYTVDGNAPLSPDQIRKIATSV